MFAGGFTLGGVLTVLMRDSSVEKGKVSILFQILGSAGLALSGLTTVQEFYTFLSFLGVMLSSLGLGFVTCLGMLQSLQFIDD